MGRFLGRIHAVGARAAVLAPAGARRPRRSASSRATGCSRTTSFRPTSSTRGGASRRRRSTACGAASIAPATCARCGCTATATPATCCGSSTAHARSAFRRFRRRAHGPRGAGPVDAALGRSRGDDAPARLRARRLRRFPRVRSARAPSRRGAAHAAPPPLLGVARAALGRSGVSRRRFRGSTRSATGRTASSNCASRSR